MATCKHMNKYLIKNCTSRITRFPPLHVYTVKYAVKTTPNWFSKMMLDVRTIKERTVSFSFSFLLAEKC